MTRLSEPTRFAIRRGTPLSILKINVYDISIGVTVWWEGKGIRGVG